MLITVIVLPILAAAVGRWAGPFLARANNTVIGAARLWSEEAQGLDTRTLRTEALRGTGRPKPDIFAEARAVEARFRVGGAWLGAWCGLVVSLKLLALLRVPRRDIYETAQADCVACGRCFLYCPRERLRLKTLADTPGQARTTGEPSDG